jgi:hypothetical protein
MLENAATLKVTPNYHLLHGRPPKGFQMLDRVRVPMFPAIAIRVQTKSTFECPDDHLAAFTAAIPEVTRLLIIGWRGSEQHMASLLHELPRAAQGMVVAGGRPAALETITTLGQLGVSCNVHVSESGFSTFLLSGAADRFLQAQ